MKIAVILTCFNRKQQTLSCLKSLFEARDNYSPKIDLHIYLTDDGCTDGTADAVCSSFPTENITILQGDGNLFWAGGMRFAWKEALKKHNEWDFYLLLNDDVVMLENLFSELLSSQAYCKEYFGKAGLISGVCCSKSDPSILTYSGKVWVNRFLGTSKHVSPSGVPQICDRTNANILFVPKLVVDIIGIFDKDYLHGSADFDYSMKARKNRIPVLISGNTCGACDNDHESYAEHKLKMISMTLKERKEYLRYPPRSPKDYQTLVRKNIPIRYPLVLIGRCLELYFPKVYYSLSGDRRKKKIEYINKNSN